MGKIKALYNDMEEPDEESSDSYIEWCLDNPFLDIEIKEQKIADMLETKLYNPIHTTNKEGEE